MPVSMPTFRIWVLLRLDSLPIALHASTAADNRNLKKSAFWKRLVFRAAVLARELSLAQIREIAAATSIQLEFFIITAHCASVTAVSVISAMPLPVAVPIAVSVRSFVAPAIENVMVLRYKDQACYP